MRDDKVSAMRPSRHEGCQHHKHDGRSKIAGAVLLPPRCSDFSQAAGRRTHDAPFKGASAEGTTTGFTERISSHEYSTSRPHSKQTW